MAGFTKGIPLLSFSFCSFQNSSEEILITLIIFQFRGIVVLGSTFIHRSRGAVPMIVPMVVVAMVVL